MAKQKLKTRPFTQDELIAPVRDPEMIRAEIEEAKRRLARKSRAKKK